MLAPLPPQELALKVMEIELPPAVMVHLLDELSNTEERLAHGGSERLQLGSLVGAFATARYSANETTLNTTQHYDDTPVGYDSCVCFFRAPSTPLHVE